MKNDPICFKHDLAMRLCEEILEMDFDRPFKTKLKAKVRKIIKVTEQAKYDGQCMEDRLQEYYDAITEIGFKRNKRK